jgi:HD-like signal output (HDOD) protein
VRHRDDGLARGDQQGADIAHELAGDVVFPTSFDSAIRLRRELQNADLPTARIAQIVRFEPLIATKLMRLASSVIYHRDGTPARTLQDAISRLGHAFRKYTWLPYSPPTDVSPGYNLAG